MYIDIIIYPFIASACALKRAVVVVLSVVTTLMLCILNQYRGQGYHSCEQLGHFPKSLEKLLLVERLALPVGLGSHHETIILQRNPTESLVTHRFLTILGSNASHTCLMHASEWPTGSCIFSSELLKVKYAASRILPPNVVCKRSLWQNDIGIPWP